MIVPSSSLELESIFSRRERATFIRESARVLFLTEYLVLVEYVEVVLPIVYCAHHAIVYNLHNRAYSSSCVSGSRSFAASNAVSDAPLSILSSRKFEIIGESAGLAVPTLYSSARSSSALSDTSASFLGSRNLGTAGDNADPA
ncbi:hypothetical protein PF001_g26682 [Phytophthora fragariae]|uniref:Uncharacterized protein n=1 Tax=Phytophthora fragariae TaxID=53985 RepID=A0A6A4BNL2_9STRA|nr:hypothetical protein PF001_g26682 [Phytophthora fragariae]